MYMLKNGKKLVAYLLLVVIMTLMLPPITVQANSWPFIPSKEYLTNGIVESGWYSIGTHDMGYLRVNGTLVQPSRHSKEAYYFEHLGKDKYYIRDTNGNYLAFEGNYAGKKAAQSAKIVASKTPCKWKVVKKSTGWSYEYQFVVDTDNKFVMTTGIEQCTDILDSKLFITKHTTDYKEAKFTLGPPVPQYIPQWWELYQNGGKMDEDGAVYVVSLPLAREYELQEGFDTHGIFVKARVKGNEVDVTSKVTFITSDKVELRQNRPFTVAGTKVIEVYYSGEKISEFNVTIQKNEKGETSPIKEDYLQKKELSKKKVGNASLSTYSVWGNPTDEDISEEDNILFTNANISNYSNVSSISQFLDPDGNLSFAYSLGAEDSDIIVNRGNKLDLHLEKIGTELGAIIQDESGNYYAVTGKRNGELNSSNKDISSKYNMKTETVFITKYSADGTLIKTTGFVGNLTSIKGAATQNPFNAGNCALAINNGILVCSYARQMYNGHQSKDVIAVNTNTMKKMYDNLSSDPWVSHSFDQKVIWYSKANSWLFVDHGDAYPRTFVADLLNPKTLKTTRNNILKFKGKSCDNKTNAQLGGVVETSKGVMFVGAAGKNGTQDTKQQLFVTVFNPAKKSTIKLTWLTSNEVVQPQLVRVDKNKNVILWEEHGKSSVTSYYMILDDSGKTITKKTSLGNIRLNAHEDPIASKQTVYWLSEVDGTLYQFELKFQIESN